MNPLKGTRPLAQFWTPKRSDCDYKHRDPSMQPGHANNYHNHVNYLTSTSNTSHILLKLNNFKNEKLPVQQEAQFLQSLNENYRILLFHYNLNH